MRAAIDAADQGDGVVVLGDLGSAILTVRAVLESRERPRAARRRPARRGRGGGGGRRPPPGSTLADVENAREEARGARKL